MNLLMILVAALSVALPSFASAQPKDLFLKVSKIDRGGSKVYKFSVCSHLQSCEVVGRNSAYTLASIKGLSGNAQRFVGAPILLIGDTVGGVIVAFVVGSTALPSATVAGVAAILSGGAAVGGVGTSLVEQSSKLRHISPKYHWDKGSTKVDIERAVRALEKDKKANSAIIYHSKNFDSIEEFYEAVEIVERITRDL